MNPLPIDDHLPDIISVLGVSKALVLTAPPGAGKTTRIPRALYDAGFADKGEILILEPRRLATRLAASRVAQEFGQKLGQTVGYSIRFESVGGPKTRIRFLTEAILARKIMRDPDLDGVSTVILDEFHERHLASDLALACLKQIQHRNQQLRLIVMSATMNPEPVAKFLTDARVIPLGESPFELEVEYEPRADDRPLHEKVAAAVLKLFRSKVEGDILVFLPGAAEIRRSAEALRPGSAHFGFCVNLLHGDIPASEQTRAIEPSGKTKVILATNVAETSITIPGIAAVIDSGLARIAGHSPWSGFPTLSTAKISKSSAKQRAGRAGRTRSGRVVRLYTRPDFESRPEQEIPEIKRADLTETALLLHGAGIEDLSSFAWFEAPAASAIEAADALLRKLGAITEQGKISDTGIRMLQLPIHPRLARLIIEGEKYQVAEECTLLAALLAERDIRIDNRSRLTEPRSGNRNRASGSSDLVELLDKFHEAEDARFEHDRVQALGLDMGAVHKVRRAQHQLKQIVTHKRTQTAKRPQNETEEALLVSVLAAFPDRVAKRRKRNSLELALAGGGSALLSPASIVHNPPFIVAVDVEERRDKICFKAANPVIRLASGIEVEWIAGLFPDSISQRSELVWNERAGKVEEARQTSFGQITLEETVRIAVPSDSATDLLVSAVFNQALSPFPDFSSLPGLRARIALVAHWFPHEQLSIPEESEIRAAVKSLCRGRRSLEEIKELSLVEAILENLTARQRALVKREAPDRIQLRPGRSVRIHYEAAAAPWIESRLQDFFGLHKTPVICGGRQSLTVHLLAPNGRDVQVTRDLAGFWERHYPVIRRELMRRYPKHSWPEPDSLAKPGP